MTAIRLLGQLAAIEERSPGGDEALLERAQGAGAPFVIRGLASDWGLVRQARRSDAAVTGYLRRFAAPGPVVAARAEPAAGGRVFYNDDLSGMNFEQLQEPLGWVLDQLDALPDDERAPTLYMGSTAIDYCLPGFAAENSLDLAPARPSVRIWLGNQHRVAAHYDVLENIAVVGAGRRRFILFPPEQLENLYVGPLDHTPAGQPVSLVDLDDPDPERFPRFEQALAAGQCAELDPGDAIYIPAMWWHHVEGLERLNALVNHWWYPGADYLAAPLDALLHAILAIRELPPRHRAAWRRFFAHYVFDADEQRVAGHIPPERRGVLGPIDPDVARRVRGLLRNKLNK